MSLLFISFYSSKMYLSYFFSCLLNPITIMIKLNEMLFKQRIEISPQIVCGINNVIILHINNAGTATQKQGLITFLSSSFILMIETFDAIHTRIVQTNISYNTIAIIRALGSLVIMPA